MKFLVCFMVILSAAAGLCAADNPQVTLQVSGAVSGTIVLELFPQEAPVTVANFVNYVQSGFYDGLIFHRVIPDFMVQGGGFDSDLVQQTTGPAIINESSNRLSNLRGTIAMARATTADSASSQFFINLVDNTGLDYGTRTYDYQYNITAQVGYCVFGEVLSGMDVVDAIASLETETVGNMQNVPVEDVILHSATVSYIAPVCAQPPVGDATGDCKVDIADLAQIAQDWMTCNSITATCSN